MLDDQDKEWLMARFDRLADRISEATPDHNVDALVIEEKRLRQDIITLRKQYEVLRTRVKKLEDAAQ